MLFLVTGAQGFLGRELVSALVKRGQKVVPVGRRKEDGVVFCDMSKSDDVRNMVEKVSPDRIIHCAANVPTNAREYQDESLIKANLQMIEAILPESNCPIVYISSMTVYGRQFDRPVCETDAGQPLSAYGRSKWLGENYLQVFGKRVRSVRIPGLFGSSRHTGVVYNTVKSAKYGRCFRLPPEPVSWAAMHVEDAAESVAALSIAPVDGYAAVNVGYRGPQSINRLISAVSRVYGCKVNYAVQQPDFEFDLTKAEKLGGLPQRDFGDALISLGEEI